jgi:hypothetical protein
MSQAFLVFSPRNGFHYYRVAERLENFTQPLETPILNLAQHPSGRSEQPMPLGKSQTI